MRLQIITLVFLGFLRINHCLPKQCSGSSTISCYPVIPSQLQICGSDLRGAYKLRLRNRTNINWNLETVPTGLFEGTSLKILELNNIGLRFLYSEILQPIKGSLEKLYMNGNLFDVFHSQVLRGMTKLQIIDLRNQEIAEFKASNGLQLNSLNTIDLSGNKLTRFIQLDLENSGPLNIILDRNRLEEINMTNIKKIEYLSVKGNGLEKVVNTSFLKSINTLKHLDLSDNKLNDEIWKSLQGMTALESLVLSTNGLTYISASVVNFQMNLKYLDLSSNHIHSLAGIRLQSGKMTHLFLNFNSISDLPYGFISSEKTFGHIWNGIIDISHNFLNDITLNLPKCERKCHVFLNNNHIVNINIYFPLDTHLEALNISGNRLIRVPHPLVKSDLYDFSDNPLNSKNVYQALHQYPLRNASQIHIRNAKIFCSKDIDTTLLIENGLMLENLKLLDLQNNCFSFDFLCKILKNNSAISTEVVFDNNVYTNKTTACSLVNRNLNAISLQNVGFKDSDIMSLFHNEKDTILTNLSSVNLNGNMLEVMPNLNITSKDKNRNLIYVISNNLLEIFPNITLTYYRKGYMYNSKARIDFSKNKISIINSMHFIFVRTHLYYNYEIVFNLSSNEIAIIDRFVSFTFAEFSYRINLYYPKFILDLSLNVIKEFKLNHLIFSIKGNVHFFGSINIFLNMSTNRLSDIPDTLTFSESSLKLVLIDLSHNFITQMPQKSEQMVQDMFLGHNNMENINFTIPDGARGSTEQLNLEFNNIVFIHFAAFKNLTSLKRLDLRGNLLHNIPKAIQLLQSLTYLDISVNKKLNLRGVTILKDIRRLKSLVLTNDDIFLSNNDQAYGLHCSCDLLFMRNYTLKTTERCSSPPEFKGYYVSCFPTTYCANSDPLYILSETIRMCRNDDFVNFSIVAKQQQNVITIEFQRIGKHSQMGLLLQLFRNNQLLEKQISNKTGNQQTFISFATAADYACVNATFENGKTLQRCLQLDARKLSLSSSPNNLTITFGTLFAIAVLEHFILLPLLIIRRRKFKNKVKKLQSTEVTNDSQVPYETISTINVPEESYDAISPPTAVYEDVQTDQTSSVINPPKKTNNKLNKHKDGNVHTNKAFDAI